MLISTSTPTSVNFLVDKIGPPTLRRTSTMSNARKAQHAIVLDIYALTFPTGRQQLNDSGATSAVEMFFEIKTFTSQKFHYVQKLIMLIFSQWIGGLMRLSCRKFKNLDSLFAADVVGDDRTSNVVEPFAAEKVRFYKGTGEYQVSSSLGRAQICSYELHFVLRKLIKYNYTLEPLRFITLIESP